MEKESHRVVKDFSRGVKQFGITILCTVILLFVFSLFEKELSRLVYPNRDVLGYIVLFIVLLSLILAIKGFLVNYVPVKVTNGVVSIPASDQIRTFIDIITINPIIGLYRRRSYNTDEIENVANGYTESRKGTKREWNVVITGMRNQKSFSQRIDCSNKQVRDEVRNVLKQTISGKVNSDFAV